jgi:predicted acylesterase/phospholipase RssA
LPGLEIHTGVALALEEAGIVPAWIGGCSAGAAAGAMIAAGYTAGEMARILAMHDAAWLVHRRPLWKPRALWLDSIADSDRIAGLLDDLLPESFSELGICLEVSATLMRPERGWQTRFSTGNLGPLRRAVLASMAVAGVWPYVRIDGCDYSDGGTSLPYPLPSRPSSFDLILVAACVSADYSGRDSSVVSRLLWNYEQAARSRRAELQVDAGQDLPNLAWINIDTAGVSMLEFSPGLGLIGSACDTAAKAIAAAMRAVRRAQPQTQPQETDHE